MNNIVTIDGHVLIPHQANWADMPGLKRSWRNDVKTAMGGDEDRLSMREAAWETLNYQVFPFNQVEQGRFQARMEEAYRVNRIAVPFFGRGVELIADLASGAKVLTLERSDHGIVRGNYVLIQSYTPAEFDTWDLGLVVSVAGAGVTLAEVVGNTHSAGTRVWPILLGLPQKEKFQISNLSRGRFQVSVKYDQRVFLPFASENFEDYPTGAISGPAMTAGHGWDGHWYIGSVVFGFSG